MAASEAQFDDYVWRPSLPNTISPLRTPKRPFPPGAWFRRRKGKLANPGISGHLGEGAGPLSVSRLMKSAIVFRLQYTTGNMIRTPDFGLRTTLKDFYGAYNLTPPKPNFSFFTNDMNIPFEAKAYLRHSSSMDVKRTMVRNGAFGQIVSYWWAMNRISPDVVGFGLVTMFAYRSHHLAHVVLVPEDTAQQKTLQKLLGSCGTGVKGKKTLYLKLQDETFRNDVFACLGGF